MDAEEVDAIARAVAARLGKGAAPRLPLSELHKKWAAAKSRLPSFDCDDMRARRLLGLEPFEMHAEDGTTSALFWAPGEGEHAGVKLADRDVATLCGDDVDDFRAWFYTRTTRRKEEPAPATVNRYVMVLKRILNHAVKRNTIQRSPLLGLEFEDEDNAREVVIEEEQLEAILDALGDDAVMRALVVLAYDSGMRLTELICCRWTWLDERNGFVHVPGAVAKNGEARITDYSMRAADNCKTLPRHVKTDLVFPNPGTAEPYNKRWIHERFVRAVERSGVVGADGTPPRMHDLRRSFITLAGRRGVPERVIMAKSGHKDHKVFKRYRIVNEAELRDTWVQMEAKRQQELAALAERRRGPKRSPDVPIGTVSTAER